MRLSTRSTRPSSAFLSLALLASFGTRLVHAEDVIRTNGFSECLESDVVKVERMNIQYNKGANVVTFDVAGTSKQTQSVTATLEVKAYGIEVYKNEFDPCKEKIDLLCPIPEGSYNASGSLPIPKEYLDKIPAIAFQIPDLDGFATLKLRAKDGGKELACLQSTVDNGKTAEVRGVSYVTAGMAAASLGLSALAAAGAGGAGGGSGGGPSPNFADVIGWFQFISLSGMNSIAYPPVYRSFTNNFGWSTGLIPWEELQLAIDRFREGSGGDLTRNSVSYLKNATLIFADSTAAADAQNGRLFRRSIDKFKRDINVNGETLFGGGEGDDAGSSFDENKIMHTVKGVQAYVEKLRIPEGNTFMTVLLIFCIVVASICVLILLFKVVLELWSMFGNLPKGLRSFKKRYWTFLASTIVRIILILYGTWVLFCMYQFRRGDSWGAHALAAVTLAIFTGVLAFFIVKIIMVAQKAKKTEGGAEALYENKPYMRKYGLFYDQFRSSFWWVFVPMIVYALLKGCFIALGDGHGLVQVGGQLACEGLLLILLLWSRPFNTKTGNVLNIIIAVVRVLSVLCLLVFVHELGIAANTKTVTGVALIVIQSVLTAALAILLVVNAIFVMCKKDPRKKRQEELEKARDMDNLTPLDPRQSMLLTKPGPDGKGYYQPTPTGDMFPSHSRDNSRDRDSYPLSAYPNAPHNRSFSRDSVRKSLIASAAPVGYSEPTEYAGYTRTNTSYRS